jgi:alkylation response protein AidB-like acyl-CoA dehydrogenase
VNGLADEEAAIVALFREFTEREIKPVVRELERANTDPAKLIDEMKEMRIFGLAVPGPWGEAQVSTQCYPAVTEELACGWMSLADAMGGHTVAAKLLVTYGTRDMPPDVLVALGARRGWRGRWVPPSLSTFRRCCGGWTANLGIQSVADRAGPWPGWQAPPRR